MFEGFDKRLESQIQDRLDKRMAIFNKMSGGNDTMQAKVAQNLVQRCAVWFGGSVLGSKEYFPWVCKTREMYAEMGPSICRHNAVFSEPF